MMINIDELKEQVGANEVLFIEKVGSKLYALSNQRDEDVIVVVDKYSNKRCSLDDKDMFIFSNDEYKRSLLEKIEGTGCVWEMRSLCALLNHEAAKTNLRNSVYYGECENRFVNMFDNKKIVFQRVLEFGKRNFFNPRIRNLRGGGGCGRMMSWALWYYYAFQNGSLELTAEQQNNLQLCHDGNLPLEYAQDLRKKILDFV